MHWEASLSQGTAKHWGPIVSRIHVQHKGADIPVGEKDVFHTVG